MNWLISIYELLTGCCWHDWVWMRNEARRTTNSVLFLAERACTKCGAEQSRISCMRHTGNWMQGRFTNPMLRAAMVAALLPITSPCLADDTSAALSLPILDRFDRFDQRMIGVTDALNSQTDAMKALGGNITAAMASLAEIVGDLGWMTGMVCGTVVVCKLADVVLALFRKGKA